MKVHKKNPYGINDEVLLDFECVETSFMVFHYYKHILFIIQTLWMVIYESVSTLDLSMLTWFNRIDLELTQFDLSCGLFGWYDWIEGLNLE